MAGGRRSALDTLLSLFVNHKSPNVVNKMVCVSYVSNKTIRLVFVHHKRID